MKKLKKGSFTLEAALLMPLLLTVIMSMLYLDFFVHNRAWLTAAAYEAAVWKDIKKKQIYMRQRIFRDGCLEARDCLEGKT